MPRRSEFPTGLAVATMSDAAFPSRKAAPDGTPPSDRIGNSRHHYRITVDKLDKLDTLDPTTGEGGLESISFFASPPNDILAATNSLRARLGCSACQATKLAVGLSLVTEVIFAQRDPMQLHEPLLELFRSLEISVAAKANA